MTMARRTHNGVPPLTPKELEVAKLTVEGLTAADIARQLRTTQRTVEAHKSNIYRKLRCNNAASMVVLLLHAGLVKVRGLKVTG